MGWLIKCCDSHCEQQSWANNIVDLINDHIDKDGWILCSCGKRGYIEKSFDLQEPGKTWEPYLRAVIPLGDEDDTYQPFVFLVSYDPRSKPTDIWFSYYKDLRPEGRLKLGYGPGGPPVLNREKLLRLIKKLVRVGALSSKSLSFL
jgi:hypothetical protein